MNFLAVQGQEGDRVRVQGGTVTLNTVPQEAPSEIGVRPEHLELCAPGAGHSLDGRIAMTEHLGSDTYAYVSLEGAEEMIVVRLEGERSIRQGEPVGVLVNPDAVHVFSADGRTLVSAKPMARNAA
jgi:multiple sugar transport system ATP-binding protein